MIIVKASENNKAAHLGVASFWINPMLVREVWAAKEFTREDPVPGTDWIDGVMGPEGWVMEMISRVSLGLQSRWSRTSPTDSVIIWIQDQSQTRVGWTAEVVGHLITDWYQRMGLLGPQNVLGTVTSD